MKSKSILLLSAITLLLSFKNDKELRCQKKNYFYSPANYSAELFMKKKYQSRFNSLLQKPVYNCFCKQTITNLPDINPSYPKMQVEVSIEPFFINLKNNDGLYGQRHWVKNAPSPHYRCGYQHYLFILSNNTYYDLTSDSIQNMKMVQEKLSNSFTKKEIECMIEWGIQDEMFCNDYTYDWPYLIKNDTTVLWDIKKEEKDLSE